MGIYEHREQYSFAAIVDPRFKVDWCIGSETARIESAFKEYIFCMSCTVELG